MKKIIIISDTHNQLNHIKIPDGDILIHCGDATLRGSPQEVEKFARCFSKLPHSHKIFIAGNHDWTFERNRHLGESILQSAAKEANTQITYLEDSEIYVDGLRIYGSPWQPEFCGWAFNKSRGFMLRRYWENIPTGVDILVTHGPPAGILDECPDGERVGCADLLDELKRVKPRVHAYGHIHHSYGKLEQNGTVFVNASLLNEAYKPTNPPIVLDL